MRYALILASILMLAGCASTPADTERAVSADPVQHAECLVCKYNADLACVDVAVNDKTPRHVYQGKTYYFCSNDCRDEFAKNPGKYLH